LQRGGREAKKESRDPDVIDRRRVERGDRRGWIRRGRMKKNGEIKCCCPAGGGAGAGGTCAVPVCAVSRLREANELQQG